MTEREAIKQIEKNIALIRDCDCTEYDMAIKALEKQIPKKIIITSKSGKVEKGNYVRYKCPNCGYEIGSAFHYPPNECMMEHEFCEKCGQALDWGENPKD